eukprot:6825615-Alexandrium_andersonii.AAC.1
MHVGDGKWGGDARMKKIVEHLRKTFAFGSEEKRGLVVCGRHELQQPDGSIAIDQDVYVKGLELVRLGAEQRENVQQRVGHAGVKLLQDEAGCLNWAAKTNPQIAYDPGRD